MLISRTSTIACATDSFIDFDVFDLLERRVVQLLHINWLAVVTTAPIFFQLPIRHTETNVVWRILVNIGNSSTWSYNWDFIRLKEKHSSSRFAIMGGRNKNGTLIKCDLLGAIPHYHYVCLFFKVVYMLAISSLLSSGTAVDDFEFGSRNQWQWWCVELWSHRILCEYLKSHSNSAFRPCIFFCIILFTFSCSLSLLWWFFFFANFVVLSLVVVLLCISSFLFYSRYPANSTPHRIVHSLLQSFVVVLVYGFYIVYIQLHHHNCFHSSTLNNTLAHRCTHPD